MSNAVEMQDESRPLLLQFEHADGAGENWPQNRARHMQLVGAALIGWGCLVLSVASLSVGLMLTNTYWSQHKLSTTFLLYYLASSVYTFVGSSILIWSGRRILDGLARSVVCRTTATAITIVALLSGSSLVVVIFSMRACTDLHTHRWSTTAVVLWRMAHVLGSCSGVMMIAATLNQSRKLWNDAKAQLPVAQGALEYQQQSMFDWLTRNGCVLLCCVVPVLLVLPPMALRFAWLSQMAIVVLQLAAMLGVFLSFVVFPMLTMAPLAQDDMMSSADIFVTLKALCWVGTICIFGVVLFMAQPWMDSITDSQSETTTDNISIGVQAAVLWCYLAIYISDLVVVFKLAAWKKRVASLPLLAA